MADAQPDRDPLEALADEFISRARSGESPSIEDYAHAHPDLADEIRDLFPTLLMMEACKPAADSSAESSGAASQGAELTVERLGDFQILREIGRGGMGIVYEAEQMSLGRHVALKVLPRQLLSGDLQIRRFEREARAAARLHHTNIVPVFGVGQDQGYHFYAMQFIHGHGLDKVLDELKRLKKTPSATEGRPHIEDVQSSHLKGSADALAHSLMTGTFSLRPYDPQGEDEHRERIARPDSDLDETNHRDQDPTPSLRPRPHAEAPSDDSLKVSGLSDSGLSIADSDSGLRRSGRPVSYWASIARIGLQVAGALQHAHDQTVVHRDIKPSNLLLDTRGTVWITDFGLAKSEDLQDLTHSGDIVGTLRYISPESLQGHTEPRSDIYSLGLTLYELAALAPAFPSTDRRALIHDIMTSNPPRLDRVNPNVPTDLATIIHKAIEREPRQRYAAARELADDLQRFLEDRPIRARRISALERLRRWSRRNKPLAASLLATAALLLLLAGGSTVAAIREVHLRRKAEEASHRERAVAEQHTEDNYAQATRLAGNDLQRLNGGAAVKRILDRWRPATTHDIDRRGWEWHYVASHNEADPTVVFDLIVTEFDWHPNGQWLAFGAPDGIVRVWKGGSKENIVTLKGHAGPVMSVQWSPTGEYLATAGLDGQLLIWNAENWTTPYSLRGTHHIRWSPTGERLAVNDRDAIRIWNVANGREEQSFDEASTTLMRWSPDGMQLAFNVDMGKIRLHNVGSPGNSPPIDFPEGHRICDVKWNIGNHLEILAWDGCVLKLYNLNESAILTTRIIHTDSIPMVSTFARISGLVALQPPAIFTTASENAIIIVDIEESRRSQLVGHLMPSQFHAWHPTCPLLASSSRDRTLRIWNTKTATQVHVFRLRAGGGPITWNAQGTRIASASTQLAIFDLEALGRSAQQPPNTPFFSISPDGRRIALGHPDEEIRFWDLAARAEIQEESLSVGQPIWQIVHSPDGSLLAANIGDGREIGIWDLSSQRLLGAYTGDWGPSSFDIQSWTWLSWSPDSIRLAAAGPGGSGVHVISPSGSAIDVLMSSRGREKNAQIYLGWNPVKDTIAWLPGHHFAEILDARGSGRLLRLDGHDEWERDASFLWRAAFSPDGRQLVTTSLMGSLRIWDVATGRALQTLQSQEAEGASVSWSPDGGRIASGDANGGLKIWDAASGRELLSVQIGEGSVNRLAWTPDGSRIIAHIHGQDHLVILDANPSFQREHVTAGLERLDLELQHNQSDPHNLLRRAEINVRRRNENNEQKEDSFWLDVARDTTQVIDLCRNDRSENDSRLALRATLLGYLAHAHLGNHQESRRSAEVAHQLLRTVRKSYEVVLPNTDQQFTDAATPFAWNVGAQMKLTGLDTGDVARALALAESAVRVLPDCGQFRVTSGVARYRNGEIEQAAAELRKAVELFETDSLMRDPQRVANVKMWLYRAANYLATNFEESAEHIFTQLILKSLGCLTEEARASTPLSPVTLAALDRYCAWFQDASEARTWLYLAMAEFRCGNRAAANRAFDTAESMLKVRPDIDNETLAVWAEATQLIKGDRHR